MSLREAWNCGGNWVLFMGVCFGAVEGFAIWMTHHTGQHWRTLSGTFWAFRARAELWATLALFAGIVVLVGHFKADWWRKQ